MSQQKYVSIEVSEVLGETEKAFLFELDGYTEWFPKSQIENDGVSLEVGHQIIMVNVTEWIAKEKGVDYQNHH